MEAVPSVKAAVKAVLSEVAMIPMMEVMKTIDEYERRTEAEPHRRPIKPRVVIGRVGIEGRRVNIAHLEVRVLLLNLPGAVGLFARKA
jgi:hypothetical protein